MTKRASREHLDVAVAVIERRGRFLICQRPKTSSHAGCWEFPGGKRNPRESWPACLRREVKEELGVSIRGLKEFDRYSHKYPWYTVTFRFFRCAIASGVPRPLDADALRWVPRGRLFRYRFPPANRRVLERLRGLGLSLTDRRGIINARIRRRR